MWLNIKKAAFAYWFTQLTRTPSWVKVLRLWTYGSSYEHGFSWPGCSIVFFSWCHHLISTHYVLPPHRLMHGFTGCGHFTFFCDTRLFSLHVPGKTKFFKLILCFPLIFPLLFTSFVTWYDSEGLLVSFPKGQSTFSEHLFSQLIFKRGNLKIKLSQSCSNSCPTLPRHHLKQVHLQSY